MRKTVIVILAALWGLSGVAYAQESAQQPQPSRPVFSLPPGDPPPERRDPDVQGPQAPGMAAPRVIDPNAPRDGGRSAQQSRSTTQSQAQSRPTPAPSQAAPTRNAGTAPPPAATRQAPMRQATQSAPPPVGTRTPTDSAIGEIAGDIAADDPLFDVGPERTAPSPAPATSDPAAVPADTDPGFPPIWLITLALLLAAGLGYFLWQRREQPVAETGFAEPSAVAPGHLREPGAKPEPEILPVPEPEPEVEPVAVAQAEPAAQSTAQLELDFEPIEARWSEAGLAIKFRLYLRNISDQPVHDVAVHLGIRSADQNVGASQGPAGLPNLFLDTLEAQDVSAHEGEMRLDDKAIQPVLVEGREMVLPVVDIMPRYRDSTENMRKIQVALLVGRERNPPGPKLAPLAVRTALGPSERLGCRMIALPGVATPAAA